MERARRAAWWLLPSLLCLAFYWVGVKSWFQGDDFGWLRLRLEITDWHSLLRALLEPRAQGTIRPLSERVFFLGLYQLFGLDALPFRICVFLTQFANLALVASITQRLTGSAAAGLWATLFWLSTSAMPHPLVWSTVYNQVLCAFFLLLAFHFLLRHIETGKRRYEVLEWAVFLVGFGAQELNVMYPVLAAAYTLACARRHFRRTLPLFVPSVIYGALHMYLVPKPSQGLYVMHFDWSIFRTLLTYWNWTVGPAWLRTAWDTPVGWVIAGIVVLSVALLALVVCRTLHGDRRPLFFLAWFVIILAPLLPLRDHVMEYYPYAAGIGLAMLGALGMALAWKRGLPWRVLSLALAAVYLLLTLQASRFVADWVYRRSRRVERLVLQVQHAHELHPGKVILLRGVDDSLFWMGVLDRPFQLFGAQVYLAPGSEKLVRSLPDLGDASQYVLPAEATSRALNEDSVVVYDSSTDTLKNITSTYAKTFEFKNGPPPRRVDVANTLTAYLLGPGWYASDGVTRWMPKRATLRIAGPRTAAEKLFLHAICPQAADGPVVLTVAADGIPLEPARLAGGTGFELGFALPKALVGKDSMELTLEVSRTITPPGDGRVLGLAFGTIEVR